MFEVSTRQDRPRMIYNLMITFPFQEDCFDFLPFLAECLELCFDLYPPLPVVDPFFELATPLPLDLGLILDCLPSLELFFELLLFLLDLDKLLLLLLPSEICGLP